MSNERYLVLWFPDWPVQAAVGPPPHGPVAVMQSGAVVVCSAEARAQGVRRGQRRRLAQSRAPELRLIEADAQRDERAFLPILRLLEELSPGIQPLRPGLIALRARGVARYYEGEHKAAHTLLEHLDRQGYHGVRAAVAEGLFTAELAAHQANPILVLSPEQTQPFLDPLPPSVLGDEELAAFLARLGIRTLAAFAALDPQQVYERFGERGTRLHTLASGTDSRAPEGYQPEPERARSAHWEEPLEQAEQVAFAVRQTAESVIDALAACDLVCTEIQIEFTDERKTVTSRAWMHPTFFEASDLVDRVRWQLEGFVPGADQDNAGIVEARFIPLRVESSAPHQPGLFGQGPGERLHHAVSRIQAFLGHRGVLLATIGGGRRLGERQVFMPWGDHQKTTREQALPWPGSLPAPLPSEVFDPPQRIQVTDAAGEVPRVDERGILSSAPAVIAESAVRSWAGPWPLRERRWDASSAGPAHRFQIVDEKDRAWLLLWDQTEGWHAEGRYL